MMTNNWQLIKEFYKLMNPHIMSGPKNEWAIDAYAWDTGLIRMTPIENWLWQDIRQSNAIMYPQYPVVGFFVDFANPVAKVAIECDGRDFHVDKAKDAARDAKLGELGWMVYRITGSDCMKEFDEENRESSPGMKLMNYICDRHGISRNSRHTSSPKP